MNKRYALLIRWTLVTVASTAAVGGAVALVSRPQQHVVPAAHAQVEGLTSVLTRSAEDADVPLRFTEVAQNAGITFRHYPAVRASVLPEDMGSGVACGDYDNDGRPDLFFVNFTQSIVGAVSGGSSSGRCRLYRNHGDMHFEDVTTEAGVGLAAFGLGAAWGDYDDDGDLDLYVTTFGANVLYQNRGDGTFLDVTSSAGVQDTRFGAGCSWADFDRDGDLDLYVCNYVDFVLRTKDRGVTERQYGTEQPYTLNPSSYPPLPNSLFRNRGDGTFEEVAGPAGVADPQGRSLSASWADLNNDGWPDLYVANDVSKNAVFLNRGDGSFIDVGAASLAADYRGAMGLAIGDIDDDLDHDLLVTHWIAQENALYRNMTRDEMLGASEGGRLWFLDSADELGLGQISLDMVGWATGLCDFDNDGRRDLWIINGSTFEDHSDHRRLRPQQTLLFWNHPERGFVNVAAQAGPSLAQPFVGRGGAQVDLDDDGRVDLVAMVHSGDARVLHNESEPSGHWLHLKLRQRGGNRFALGARAYVTVGEVTQMAEVGCSSSYLSQDDLTLHFGLGAASTVDVLRVVWPDGTEDRYPSLAVNQTLTYTNDAHYPVAPLDG
ncbi:MAG: CRTAC1 family protein [bacterium]|nr:CRTAC1 family protein [bacterium]